MPSSRNAVPISFHKSCSGDDRAVDKRPTIPSPNHPGPGTRQFRTASVPQSPLKLFKLASPIPVYPASPVPSYRNHGKKLLPTTPPSLCLLTAPVQPHVSPSPECCMPLLLGTVTNYPFSGNHLLIDPQGPRRGKESWPSWAPPRCQRHVSMMSLSPLGSSGRHMREFREAGPPH